MQPTSREETYAILTHINEVYGTFHHVQYTEEALHACVKLTDRYISDRFFPDKAIDAMDEAGALVGAKTTDGNGVVTEADIAFVVSRMSGIPVQRVAQAESRQLRRMNTVLKQRVIGQDGAIDTIVKAIQRSRIGLRNPNKPIGTFFLLGSTGVGKTHLAQCLAEEMFGSQDAIIRFDMSEFIEKHTISLLVGAPPGYIAHEEGGKLTEAVRRKPYSIILFDEIEKAHADIFNILLQVMDEGRLTDRQGRVVDFCNTIIIMTSNVGTRQLNEFGTGIGFNADKINEKQISLTGHSMGGTGAWMLALAYPNTFSAVAPLSGSVTLSDININKLKNMPVWAVVGTQDTIVEPQSSIDFINKLAEVNDKAKLTELNGADHFAVPSMTYLSKEFNVVEWLISNTK